MTQDFLKKIAIEGRVTSTEGMTFETSQRPNVLIPICCREGWESCIHTAKKQKKVKTNVGL